jgi:hypothetical protein
MYNYSQSQYIVFVCNMLNAQKVHSKGCKLSFYILQMPQKLQNVFKPPNHVAQLTKATFSL